MGLHFLTHHFFYQNIVPTGLRESSVRSDILVGTIQVGL